MMPTSRSMRVALLSLLAISCGHDPTAPRAPEGWSYALVRSGESNLPIAMVTAQGDSTVLLSEVLVFGSAPTAESVATYRYAGPNGQPRVETTRVGLEYRVVGDTVEVGLFSHCPPNALCSPNFAGRLDADQLVLALKRSVSAPAYVYSRLRPVE